MYLIELDQGFFGLWSVVRVEYISGGEISRADTVSYIE